MLSPLSRPSSPPPVRGGSEAPLWPEGCVEKGAMRGMCNLVIL